jgi:GntR family transcriptional regulator
LWFHINSASGIPIYLQLVQQVEQAVASGLLTAGQQLPSVRDLALQLTINPNTVARAYRELERSGVVLTTRGRGTFVADAAARALAAGRRETVEAFVRRVAAESRRLGVEPEALAELLKDRSGGGKNE